MVEAIQTFFLETLGKELCVFFCSMVPLIELRGSILIGAGLNLPFYANYIVSVIGNMIQMNVIKAKHLACFLVADLCHNTDSGTIALILKAGGGNVGRGADPEHVIENGHPIGGADGGKHALALIIGLAELPKESIIGHQLGE